MTRQEAVQRAIRFDAPLKALATNLRQFGWDAPQPLATVRRIDVIATLDRFLRGELSAEDACGWAELLEAREDVGFEPGAEVRISEAIFWLANPEMNLPRKMLDHDFAIYLRERLDADAV